MVLQHLIETPSLIKDIYSKTLAALLQGSQKRSRFLPRHGSKAMYLIIMLAPYIDSIALYDKMGALYIHCGDSRERKYSTVY